MTKQELLDALGNRWKEGEFGWLEGVKDASVAVDAKDLVIFTENATYGCPLSVIDKVVVNEDYFEIWTTNESMFRLEGVID
jgi:hypothetical protein